jgi:hypothetical protein
VQPTQTAGVLLRMTEMVSDEWRFINFVQVHINFESQLFRPDCRRGSHAVAPHATLIPGKFYHTGLPLD